MSEIATRSPQQELVQQIRSDQFRSQLAAALPEGISVERFQRVTVTAIMENPGLADPKVDRQSLFLAVIKAAQTGLLPDNHEAAIVLFKDKATFMPMVAGFRKIAAEHGWTLRSNAVYANDEFEHTTEPPSLRHVETAPGKERGDLVAAYCVARHRDGRREQRVMYADDILKRKAVAKTTQVWDRWPAEMWAKTPTRDLFGELPMDSADALRLARVIAADRLAPGEAARELYGPQETGGDAAAETLPQADPESPPASQPPAEGPQDPEAAAASAGAGEPEPGIEGDADIQALADKAADYVPPSGKFSAQGQHGPKPLREILALGPDGERWLRWALFNVVQPPEYIAAVTSFARVYAPGPYQEALARKEMGA